MKGTIPLIQYVSYANSASAMQILQPSTSQIVVATPLVAVSSSYAITLPITANTGSAAASVDDDLDASMESLLESLSRSVGAALWNELGGKNSREEFSKYDGTRCINVECFGAASSED